MPVWWGCCTWWLNSDNNLAEIRKCTSVEYSKVVELNKFPTL